MDGIALPSWPTNRADAYEAHWIAMWAGMFTSGIQVIGSGRFRVWSDGESGLTTKVEAGSALISGIYIESTMQQGLAHQVAHASLDRWDRIVLTLDLQSPATGYLRVITGTAQSTPVPPALTVSVAQIDIPIGRALVRHGHNAIASTDVVDERNWSMPVTNEEAGVMKAFLGTTAPNGYLLMKGQTVNTVDYPALARARGETGTTMVIPDMTKLFTRGPDSTSSNVGTVEGADSVVLGDAHLPLHTHSASQAAHAHGVTDPGHVHAPVRSGIDAYQMVVASPNNESSYIMGKAQIAPGAGNTNATFSFLASAQTGITILGAQPAITVGNAGHATPDAVPTVPRSLVVNWIVKAH